MERHCRGQNKCGRDVGGGAARRKMHQDVRALRMARIRRNVPAAAAVPMTVARGVSRLRVLNGMQLPHMVQYRLHDYAQHKQCQHTGTKEAQARTDQGKHMAKLTARGNLRNMKYAGVSVKLCSGFDRNQPAKGRLI